MSENNNVLRVQYSEVYKSLNLPLFEAPRTGDAGYDIRTIETTTFKPGEQVALPTGLHMAIPSGYVGLVKDRSSMAKRGFTTSAGVIDSDYRGELLILVRNQSEESQTVEQGERIAQLLILPIFTFPVEEAPLDDTERGQGGFGSTGRQ